MFGSHVPKSWNRDFRKTLPVKKQYPDRARKTLQIVFGTGDESSTTIGVRQREVNTVGFNRDV